MMAEFSLVVETATTKSVSPQSYHFQSEKIYTCPGPPLSITQEDIPEDFLEGLKEINAGELIDLDTALNEPPPEED